MSFDASATDTAIKHDNIEELRAAYANSSKANTSALQNAAGQDFNL